MKTNDKSLQCSNLTNHFQSDLEESVEIHDTSSVEFADSLNNCNVQITKEIIITTLKYALNGTNNILTDDKNKNLFKSIHYTFQSLSNLIKFLLLHVNDKQYAMANTKKIIFPDCIDNLIIVIATFDKAFDEHVVNHLFNLVDFPSYEMLYKISNINQLMVPFVVNKETDYTKIEIEFNSFKTIVTNFACYVLNLNSFLEPSIVCNLESLVEPTNNSLEIPMTSSTIKDQLDKLKKSAIKCKIDQLESRKS
jgi:hypothetical protein